MRTPRIFVQNLRTFDQLHRENHDLRNSLDQDKAEQTNMISKYKQATDDLVNEALSRQREFDSTIGGKIHENNELRTQLQLAKEELHAVRNESDVNTEAIVERLTASEARAEELLQQSISCRQEIIHQSQARSQDLEQFKILSQQLERSNGTNNFHTPQPSRPGSSNVNAMLRNSVNLRPHLGTARQAPPKDMIVKTLNELKNSSGK